MTKKEQALMDDELDGPRRALARLQRENERRRLWTLSNPPEFLCERCGRDAGICECEELADVPEED
jgi:hypothetical protein